MKGGDPVVLNKEEIDEFRSVTRPVIKWLNDNCHPHVTVVITTTTAELSEGVCAEYTMEFVHD